MAAADFFGKVIPRLWPLADVLAVHHWAGGRNSNTQVWELELAVENQCYVNVDSGFDAVNICRVAESKGKIVQVGNSPPVSSLVLCHMSYVTCHLSSVPSSILSFVASTVPCPQSHVLCHMHYVTCHLSPVP